MSKVNKKINKEHQQDMDIIDLMTYDSAAGGTWKQKKLYKKVIGGN